jgi:succinate dehydrogenase / fumarate reductase iron-sulfur subunit
MTEQIEFRIRRQDGPETAPYWQAFRVPWRPGHNVVSALMVLRENPETASGERVQPVAWEFNCMEEVCGACSMMVNGVPRQGCAALIDDLEQPIVLEPLAKFPVVRDLMVDRAAIFGTLQRVKAWIEIDGAWSVHQGAPRISPQEWLENYHYSQCMSCGCCLAACPQYGPGNDFVGPNALAQVRLMNAHPTGRYNRTERLHAIMAAGGLSDCGNAQNCVRVCPKEIPLTTAIGELGREVTLQLARDLFGKS